MGFMSIAVDYRPVFLGIHHKDVFSWLRQPLDSLRYRLSGILLLFPTGIIRGSKFKPLPTEMTMIYNHRRSRDLHQSHQTNYSILQKSRIPILNGKIPVLIGWSWFTNPNRNLSWNKSLLSSLTLIANSLHGVLWLCHIPMWDANGPMFKCVNPAKARGICGSIQDTNKNTSVGQMNRKTYGSV